MKLIDHTPFQNENGEIALIDRIKGTLQFGFSWYPDLQAQKEIISRMDKALDKNYTLIRNFPLGKSGITIPMILVGPAGVFVIQVTNARGVYRAKGNTWGTIDGDKFTPAAINILERVSRLARALQVYLERQDLKGFGEVEPVIMCADPGLHVETVRPIARVVMSDAVERFAGSLLQGRPVFTVEAVYELVDRILKPRSPKKQKAETQQPAAPEPENADHPVETDYYGSATDAGEASPFLDSDQFGAEAAGEVSPFLDTNDLGFAFEDEAPAFEIDSHETDPGRLAAYEPTQAVTNYPRKRKKSGFLNRRQIILLALMGLGNFCLIAFFLALVMNLITF
ncbi:MAG: NERD domain-containing protein [Anaerolineales bacterium]|nr:NERD domain-containing protein [Anaerolineales bacterium]